MSSPQVEDGYTRIANELMDALCLVRIPGQARQVLDFIMRKTYGFNKASDCIANSQFVAGTGLKKDKVCHMLDMLAGMNLIIVAEKGNNPAKTYAINKDYASWRQLPKKAKLPIKAMAVANISNNCCPIGIPQKTKDNSTKDKKIKRLSPVNSVANNGNNSENPKAKQPVTTKQPDKELTARVKEYPPEIVEFVTAFQNHALRVHGRKAQPITPALVNSGCKTVDQIIRLDKFTLDEIRETMRWAAKDDFWQDNVLSLAGLRRLGDGGVSKFKIIRLRFEAAQQGKQSSGSVRPNGNQQARACLDALLELRRLGKWKAPSAYSSSLKVDCSSLEPDPVRDAALRNCPPPNDTWKIDHEWVRDFTKAYEAAAKEAA